MGVSYYENMEKWVSAIMKTWKNDCHVTETHCTANFAITDPPNVWVSSFPSVDENGKIAVGHYEKNGKMAATLQKLIIQQNFQLLTPKSLGSLLFQVLTEMEKLALGIMKNGRWLPIHGNLLHRKFPIEKGYY